MRGLLRPQHGRETGLCRPKPSASPREPPVNLKERAPMAPIALRHSEAPRYPEIAREFERLGAEAFRDRYYTDAIHTQLMRIKYEAEKPATTAPRKAQTPTPTNTPSTTSAPSTPAHAGGASTGPKATADPCHGPMETSPVWAVRDGASSIATQPETSPPAAPSLTAASKRSTDQARPRRARSPNRSLPMKLFSKCCDNSPINH